MSKKQEEPETTKVEWAQVRKVLQHLAKVKQLYALSIGLLILLTLLTAAKVWIIPPTLGGIINGGATMGDLRNLIAIAAVIFLFQPVLNWAYSITNKIIAGRVIMSLRRGIFEHLLEQPLGFFATRHSTDLASRVVNDMGQFEFSITMLQMLIRDAMVSIMLVCVMFYYSWTMALVCGVVGVGITLVLTFHNRRIMPQAQESQKNLGLVASHVTELIAGMELVVSFGMRKTWQERFRGVNQDHYDATLDLEKTRAKAFWAIQSISGIGVVTILAVTGWQVIEGLLAPEIGVTLIMIMYLLQGPMGSFGNQFTQITRGIGAANRAFELLEVEPEVSEPTNPAAFPKEMDIEFQDVSFGYSDEVVLEDVSFSLKEGQSIAFVGGSGAGKSTVARLILRFYDCTQGKVLLGGVPVDQLERKKLYQAMSYVPQDSFLFDGTLRENLTIGRPDASEDEIHDCLRRACLTEYVERLPQGLDTTVGERGLSLSGGERQRVAIARALLRHPRVMILDEATSAMDVDLEGEILQELVGRHDMTVVAITHRPRMAYLADRVLRLRRGRLQEEDGPVNTVEV